MSSSTEKSNNSNNTGNIQTYNIMGGGLEGFAVPVGLLRMSEASQMGGAPNVGGNDFSRMRLPEVTDVSAIPHGLYEKLLKLSQYNSYELVQKKQNKSRKNKIASNSRKSKKVKR